MFLLNSVLVSIFTFLLMFGDSHNRRKGALYVDNGYDQTEIEDMSLEENNRMELEMLSILGLDSTPLRSRSHSNNDPIGSPTVPKFRTFNDVDNFEKLKNTDSRTKLASKFLLDLYDSLMEEDDELSRRQRALEHNLNEDEQFAIDVSDVIMTFDNIDDESTNARPEKGKRLWFDFSKLSTTGTVIGGELRVYQNKLNAQRRNKTVYTVIVYELVYKYSGESSLERISSVSTTQSFSGWLGINLTDSLISWVRLFDYSKGLYLAVHLGDKPGHEIMPEEIGISVVNNGEGTQPFMVAFLEARNEIPESRYLREISTTASTTNNRVKKNFQSMMMFDEDDSFFTSTPCRVHTLYVSFKDLGWEDWIIAPQGYSLNYCAGECIFPLSGRMNATNHALMQTVVHLMFPYKIPRPCCAPFKLAPISVLYWDNGTVVLKKYRKMAIRTCGCH